MAKILLIEHTNIMKLRLEKLFVGMGYSEVITYHNSIFTFENLINKIDNLKAIVIDFDQVADEFNTLIKQINAVFIDQKIKIIVLTSKTDIKEMMYFFTKGVDEVLLKPFSNEQMFEKLNRNQSNDNHGDLDFIKKTISDGVSVLRWCKDYEIGIEEIDKEHKAIIEHFEKLYTLMKDGHGHEYFHEMILFLEHYVSTHFEHEELLQIKIGYDKYETHKRLHDAFKIVVEKMITQYDGNHISNADLVKLNLFVKEWLSHHILIEDKKISEFISNNKL